MAEHIQSSAPGKLMLMGEHAVLHGRRALVAAVDQRFNVTVTPRRDDRVSITSALGNWQGTLDNLTPVQPFTFILQAVKRASPQRGFELAVASAFRDDVGLGSSSAVTVATVAALQCLITAASTSLDDARRQTIFTESLAVVRDVQGAASGADLAAAVYGGVVAYRSDPLDIQPLSALPPIVAVYSGSKRKTAEVIQLVEAKRQKDPQRFNEIYDAMEDCVNHAIAALGDEDWRQFGRLLDQHQKLMQAIGVSNEKLDTIIHKLRETPDIHGAKISGAGLGDCVIAVGGPKAKCNSLDLALSPTGLTLNRG